MSSKTIIIIVLTAISLFFAGYWYYLESHFQSILAGNIDIINREIAISQYEQNKTRLTAALVTFFIISSGAGVFFYLSRSTGSALKTTSETGLSRTLERQVDRLEKLQQALSQSGGSAAPLAPEEQTAFREAIEKNLEESLSDVFLEKLEAEYGGSIRTVRSYENLETNCQEVEQRLTSELRDLQRRGNVNLTIGVVTTLIAISVLIWAVLENTRAIAPATDLSAQLSAETNPLAIQDLKIAAAESSRKLNWNRLIQDFLPRVTLALFIEVFSFFFLRLYSSGLNDIKYYQNELTNVQSKLLVLRHGIYNNDEDLVSSASEALVKTERNFVLKKGESTVDLEKSRLDQQTLRDMLTAFASTVKGRKQEDGRAPTLLCRPVLQPQRRSMHSQIEFLHHHQSHKM